MDAQGRLHFAGRDDAVIKLNGVRVDTEGVEMLLLDVPGLREAAVTIFNRRPGRAALAAFYTTDRGYQANEVALREFMSAHLPAVMVPARFVRMEQLPRTPSGKIDRQALRLPQVPFATNTLSKSDDRKLRELGAIWADAFGHADIHQDSKFFKLGRDSLLAATVVADVEAMFGVEFPITLFALAATLRAQAAEVQRQLSSPEPQPLTETQTVVLNACRSPMPWKIKGPSRWCNRWTISAISHWPRWLRLIPKPCCSNVRMGLSNWLAQALVACWPSR